MKSKRFYFKGQEQTILVLFLVLFSSSFVFGLDVTQTNSDLRGVVLTPPTATAEINYSSVNVNNSQYLQGYQWANAPYPDALYSTYNGSYALAGNCPAGQVLQNATNGGVQCVTVSVSPAGSDTFVQYNDNGTFGGSSSFKWINSSKQLQISNPGDDGVSLRMSTTHPDGNRGTHSIIFSHANLLTSNAASKICAIPTGNFQEGYITFAVRPDYTYGDTSCTTMYALKLTGTSVETGRPMTIGSNVGTDVALTLGMGTTANTGTHRVEYYFGGGSPHSAIMAEADGSYGATKAMYFAIDDRDVVYAGEVDKNDALITIVRKNYTGIGKGNIEPVYPLDVKTNVNGITLWTENNISTDGIILRNGTTQGSRVSSDYLGNIILNPLGSFVNITKKLIVDQDIILRDDNDKIYVGTAQDGSLTYDGTNMVANPDEVGSGDFVIHGDGNVTENLLINGNISVKRPFAMFSSTATQTIAVSSTAYPVTLNQTEESYQIVRSSDNANFSVQQNGEYLIDISAIVSTDTANKHVEVWVRKNNINVPRSNTKKEFTTPNAEYVLSVPFIISLNTTDSLTIMWASDDAGSSMVYTPATAYSPESPSIIMTMTKVSEIV